MCRERPSEDTRSQAKFQGESESLLPPPQPHQPRAKRAPVQVDRSPGRSTICLVSATLALQVVPIWGQVRGSDTLWWPVRATSQGLVGGIPAKLNWRPELELLGYHWNAETLRETDWPTLQPSRYSPHPRLSAQESGRRYRGKWDSLEKVQRYTRSATFEDSSSSTGGNRLCEDRSLPEPHRRLL